MNQKGQKNLFICFFFLFVVYFFLQITNWRDKRKQDKSYLDYNEVEDDAVHVKYENR